MCSECVGGLLRARDWRGPALPVVETGPASLMIHLVTIGLLYWLGRLRLVVAEPKPKTCFPTGSFASSSSSFAGLGLTDAGSSCRACLQPISGALNLWEWLSVVCFD